MAKTFKRLSVPLTESSWKAIEKLADARRASAGSTISDFLEQMEPQILKLAAAIDAAKTNPDLAYKLLHEMSLEAQKDLREEQLDMLEKSAN